MNNPQSTINAKAIPSNDFQIEKVIAIDENNIKEYNVVMGVFE